MKRKQLLILLTCVLAAFVLTVLPFSPVVAESAQSTLPRELSFGSQRIGTLGYVIGSAFAQVVTKHTPMSAVMKTIGGDTILIPKVSEGTIDVYPAAAAPGMVRAYEGTGEFKGKDMSNLRVLFQPFVLQLLGLAVRASSDIHHISQLRGKRVTGGFPAQVTMQHELIVFLRAGGLTLNDVKIVPVADMIENYRAMREGRVDACIILGATIPGAVELNSAVPLRVLSLEKQAKDIPGFYKLLPGDETMVVRPRGILKQKGVIGLSHPFWAFTSTHLSDDAAYAIVKAVYTNYKELHSSHAMMKGFTPQRMLAKPPIPYDDGAVRFYKEKGVWTEKLDKIQKSLLEVRR